MTTALRAISAWRPSGLSRRPSSPVRSTSRVRLACIASSLRSAFSLRRRCLSTPGRFLDQRPARVGPGVQHLVELALADDDVHLPAEAGVGQQLRNVQQPALVAVDRVLALPGPEQQPADRDLGIVDRQRAVAVVDGQRHLGAAEGGTARRSGEDDVLHLAAAQRLDALLAHHPGERVDDVGLARAVRADDAGDARLELQRGGRGERLEPAQGEGLQVHPANSSPATGPADHDAGHGAGGPFLRTLPRPLPDPAHSKARRTAITGRCGR